VTYQAPITGLHSPTLLLFLQNSTDYLMLAQSCKFGVNCCFIGLTHPVVCTRARVLWLLDMSTDPPFYPVYSKRVPIDWAWAEDSKYIFIISVKCPSKILERGSQKVETPLTPPPSRPSRIELIYIPIDSSQSQDSDYKIKNAINSWRPKVTRTGASCRSPKKLNCSP